MRAEQSAGDRLLKFYRECLRGAPPVASIELIRDSQTARILAEIFAERECPSIVDYGCGSLRLLHALLTTEERREWTYFGIDVSNPAELFPESFDRLRLLPHR